MTASLTSSSFRPSGERFRPFEIGSSGWCLSDLSHPEIARRWAEGRHELVEGVIANMPAALLYGNRRLQRLIRMIEATLAPGTGEFAQEIDTVLKEDRIVRPDAVFMTPSDDERQRLAMTSRGIKSPEEAMLYVAPTLIIESVSQGHERHDRITKRMWYAEAVVPNYWLLDSLSKRLECLQLTGEGYQLDPPMTDGEVVRPSLFPGLVIDLAELWA